jgi:hypothetical protein
MSDHKRNTVFDVSRACGSLQCEWPVFPDLREMPLQAFDPGQAAHGVMCRRCVFSRQAIMKSVLIILSVASCTGAALAQVPDTSPGSHPPGYNPFSSVTPAPSQGMPKSNIQSSGSSTASTSQSGPGNPGASPLPANETGTPATNDAQPAGGSTSSRPAGGYWLGGGNVYGDTQAPSSGGGASAASSGEASAGSAAAGTAAAGTAAAGRANASSRPGDQAASASRNNNTSDNNTAQRKPSLEECRSYARHRSADQANGQSAALPSTDPCAAVLEQAGAAAQ